MRKSTFKVFLSHRYKSPAVNQYFFEALTAHANIQFEVDTGTKATNVTRLERFVRDSDAFVGIYPFPSDDDARPDLQTAKDASKYFRLELDLAVRSRRPAMVFIDKRYGTAITVAGTVREFRYDHRELTAVGANSFQRELQHSVGLFCAEVAASIELIGTRKSGSGLDQVGLILPDGRSSAPGYSKSQIEMLEEQLKRMSLNPIRLDWRSAIDGAFLRQLEDLDWVVVDIGADACGGGLPAFLHGHFFPQMRLLRLREGDAWDRSPMETTLLAAFEVGYPKDIVRWRTGNALKEEVVQRLATMYEPRKHIADNDQASTYFASAALRKEAVFVSYSNEDRDFAARLVETLKKKFQQVFDYRDAGESIVPGRNWLDEVFDKLSQSAIGIPLLSSSFISSGNCKHEAQQMIALSDSGKLQMVPVKVNDETLAIPTWLQSKQYLRGWEYRTATEIVTKIIGAYDSNSPFEK